MVRYTDKAKSKAATKIIPVKILPGEKVTLGLLLRLRDDVSILLMVVLRGAGDIAADKRSPLRFIALMWIGYCKRSHHGGGAKILHT